MTKKTVLLSMFFSIFNHSVFAEVVRPYKEQGEFVVYQKYSNLSPEILNDAVAKDFEVIYKSSDFTIATSNGNLYCNSVKLPTDFDVSNARVLDGFLTSGKYSYAKCQQTKFQIDGETLKALSFPFYKDKNHLFTVTGEQIAGVDLATLQTVNNQAYDKNNYYFVASEDVTLAYKNSVELFGQCAYWAKIDGSMHFEGKKRKDIDVNSFKCLNDSTAIDNRAIYSFGNKTYTFPKKINTATVKQLAEEVIRFEDMVLYTRLTPMLLKGLNADKVKVNDNIITDGSVTWECANFIRGNNPICALK